METAYHRRPVVVPADVTSDVMVRVGSGFASLGYYVYHGGTNPRGTLSHLQEEQRSGGDNDMPVRSYDFAAPLSEFGEERAHYRDLRLQHYFLHRWGADLVGMPVSLPQYQPAGAADAATLRWAVRGNASAAIVSVCNYQRLYGQDPHPWVRFRVQFPSGRAVTLPSAANASIPPPAPASTPPSGEPCPAAWSWRPPRRSL